MRHKDFDLLNQRGAGVSVDMASALSNFGFVQLRAGQYLDALTSFSKALPLWTQLSGFESLRKAITEAGVAETYEHLGRLTDSAKIFEEVLPVFEQRCGADSLRTADILKHYALVLRREGRRDEAKKIEVRAGRIFAEYAVLASNQPIDVLQLPP